VDNVKKMTKDFDNVEVVTLEENYRNTNCILNGAYHVIQQGKG
jgi:superfamily I DNA/RNA helicase